MEIQQEEQATCHYINIFFCGSDFWSFIPENKASLVLTNGYYETAHQFLKWKYFLFEGLEQQTFTSISQLIQAKCSMKNKAEHNCVLICKVDSNIKETVISLIKSLQSITDTSIRPPVIFLSNCQETIIQIRSYINVRAYDPSMISLVSYKNNHPQALMVSLFKASSLLNQLGDEYAFPVNSNKANGSQIFTVIEKDHVNRFNIILIGESGSGKSTHINITLQEKRSLVKKGMAVTNRIIQYKHKSKPIALYDTPGFESPADTKSLLINIKDFVSRFKEHNKDSIHLILFFINGDHDCITNYAVDLLRELYKLNIPLYYIVTRCDKPNGIFKEQIIRKMLIQYSFKDPKVIGIDQISYHRLKDLYTLLHIEFSKIKFSNEQINKIYDDTADYKTYANVFHSLFFQNITEDELILKSRDHVKTSILISLVKASAYFARSKIPYVGILFSDFDRPDMVGRIAECYNSNITADEAEDLLDSFDVKSLLENFRDSEISNQLNMDFLTQWFKDNIKVSKENLSELMKCIQLLLRFVPGINSENTIAHNFVLLFFEIIELLIIGFCSINYFEARIRKMRNHNYLIAKALICYNSAIDFFSELANNF